MYTNAVRFVQPLDALEAMVRSLVGKLGLLRMLARKWQPESSKLRPGSSPELLTGRRFFQLRDPCLSTISASEFILWVR